MAERRFPPTLFLVAAKVLAAHGYEGIKGRPNGFLAVDIGAFRFEVNATREEQRGVQPFGINISRGGLPICFMDPSGGILAHVSEEDLMAELRTLAKGKR